MPTFHDALLHRYREFGPIFKETIAGETVVHLLDPEFIKVTVITSIFRLFSQQMVNFCSSLVCPFA